jgi:FMN phosphatase YigB (HAD superfamily)
VELFRPEAILFDVGGTLLLEQAYDLPAGLSVLLGDPSLPTREGPEASARLAEDLSQATRSAHAGGGELRLRDWLRGVCNEPACDARIEQAELAVWRAGVRLTPAPGVHDLLDELAAEQVPLAAVSNSIFGARCLAAELERHGLRRSFPCIVSSADLGRRKPDAAPFREALRRLRAHASRTWHVGDRFSDDVVGAASAGLGAVWLDASDASPPDATPHQRTSSLDALLALYLESQSSR